MCHLSPSRNRTRAPCIGRWTPNHWTTREVPSPFFNCLFGCTGSSLLHISTSAFSSCSEQGLLFVVVCGLLIVAAPLVAEPRLQMHGLQELHRPGAMVVALVALVKLVEFSWTRDQTCVPCIGRQIPIHCTTKEVLSPPHPPPHTPCISTCFSAFLLS